MKNYIIDILKRRKEKVDSKDSRIPLYKRKVYDIFKKPIENAINNDDKSKVDFDVDFDINKNNSSELRVQADGRS